MDKITLLKNKVIEKDIECNIAMLMTHARMEGGGKVKFRVGAYTCILKIVKD